MNRCKWVSSKKKTRKWKRADQTRSCQNDFGLAAKRWVAGVIHTRLFVTNESRLIFHGDQLCVLLCLVPDRQGSTALRAIR